MRPIYLHKEKWISALVFCTLVALLVFALLELQARRAGVPHSGQTFLALFVPLTVVMLVFANGSTLRRLADRSPPMAATLEGLAFPSADRYVTAHA